MRFRLNLDKKTTIYIILAVTLFLVVSIATYVITGVKLKADLPIVRNIVAPEVIAPVSQEASYIAVTWEDIKAYHPPQYNPLFAVEETEDQFYLRMSDVDRRSLYQLTQKYPDLLNNGLSYITFDATQSPVSDLLDAETDAQLKIDILAGAVKTKEGHTVLAMDGMKSLILISIKVNDTDGFMALTYDKSKLVLSVTSTAFEGWWGTMNDHLNQNEGAVAAIPANNYTYNAKAGYGVVDGGFVDNAIPRYKLSGNLSSYMGFTREGVFSVGDKARYGNINFSEGLGVLLYEGTRPVVDVVPEAEQVQIFEALATYIKSTGQNPEAEGYVAVPVIEAFIDSFDSNLMKAKVSWVIKNEAIVEAEEEDLIPEGLSDVVAYVATKEAGEGVTPELSELSRLVVACDTFGAVQYTQAVVPVRSAYNAIGQREVDGATVLFGIGGAKKADSRNLPGNGATVEELQQLLLDYGFTNAAMTTSGDRVGFGWKDQSLLHVQDTTNDGGRSYGAYILK